VTSALTLYVERTMGKKFVEPQPFDLGPCFADSTRSLPLIFVLSQGTDPMAGLLKFAEGLNRRVESVSLGQGQGPVAIKMVEEGIVEGHWVVLQNCHLAKTFMPALERLCEINLNKPDVHRDFRVWCTSYPSPLFPITVLENGIKMVNEAPKGLRAGLMRTYMSDPVSDDAFFLACNKPETWRKMLFGLSFFHSFLQNRIRYGAIGFNIPYEFNENDLRMCLRQLAMFLDENDEAPYETLKYTAGECNYGGKVTDGTDRVTLMTIMDIFYTPRILDDAYKFSTSGLYSAPPFAQERSAYTEYIASLPLLAAPEAYGLHSNADITKDIKDTTNLLDSLMSTQSRDSGGAGGKSADEMISDVASDIASKLAPNFDLEAIARAYPQDYFNSNNTVLVQECSRVNNLLAVVRSTMNDLQKAVKGLILLSDTLDKVGQSLLVGKVPATWLKKSFPSLKPLGSYVKELCERVDFFQKWIDGGPPVVFWLPGFFFTQAFLTASKQNFARKFKIEIDKVDFDFMVKDAADDCKAPPEDGVYCKGLFFDGGAWDSATHSLTEAPPKVLYTEVPVIWMIPMQQSDFSSFAHYSCPMYKTSERRGILSTTGHSTNHVMNCRIPSAVDASHWVLRGLAMLTALSD
jgi:dynein heavy chain